MLERASHYLPDQGPIGVFVHHNTLHAFAGSRFHDAVARASALFGAEPYPSEDSFRAWHRQGRIRDEDLDAAIAAGCPDDPVVAATPGWALRRAALRRLAMLHPMDAETPAGLRYCLEEGALDTRLARDVPAAAAARIIDEGVRHVRAVLDGHRDHQPAGTASRPVDALALSLAAPGASLKRARACLARLTRGKLDPHAVDRALARDHEAFAVKALWARCQTLTRAVSAPPPPPPFRLGPDGTHRELLLHITGEDIHRLVDPQMIRLAAAYLDLGASYWPMPGRARGFYRAVAELLTAPPAGLAPWLRHAADDLRARRAHPPHQVIADVLDDLGVPAGAIDDYLGAVLRALPGWAGMMSRLERHPEDRPAGSPPASLADFTAVRLVLERAAIAHVARASLGWRGPLARLAQQHARARRPAPAPGDHDRAYRLFRLLCVAGVSALAATELDVAGAQALLSELDAFDALARRRTFHEAYERHHRHQILDALAAHRPHVAPAPAPRCQVMVCIDEREESLRRHLEELDPTIETFGAAGFFGVAMDFRGLDDAHPVPLCPVAQRPAHEVEEHPHGDDHRIHTRRVTLRRLWARMARALQVGSRSLVRGQLLTALGSAAALPMAGQVLFPRASGRLRQRMAESLLPRPRTLLRSARHASEAEARSARGKLLGFTVDEKVERVASLLEGAGLVRGFAPLILVLGHGSTSRNNPHESAHDCGACSGRHGGPSARLFAKMANRSEVRAGLRARGIDIPDTTWFLGGMHDTASDAVTLYDADQVPDHASEQLADLRRLLDQARARDAHERCRRFASAPRRATPARALRHVEARTEHLAEPRPEYGHAGNAVCVVGRRALTRGLFLDRRAFLVSYDPPSDADGRILERTLAAIAPVGAGINLEYYFSFVDNERYGCGTKLPHNIVGLLGVMNGPESDLRTGLPWQMVEIHEPVRLLTIVEATPARLLAVAERQPGVGELVVNRWIQLVSVDPDTGAMAVYGDQGFVPYQPADRPLPVVASSMDWYAGRSEHLAPVRIDPRENGAHRAAR